MEWIQQVSVQVAGARMGDARPLFDDLEAHRRELRGMRGFMSMSISRSTEAGGNILVAVESRWRDERALQDYEQSARTAESIIRGHRDLIEADTLSVRRLEALDTQAEPREAVLYERFASALLVPAGILVGGLAIIYALSRVYLEMGSDGATPLAIIVAVLILLVAWYFASNKSAPAWQMAAVGSFAVAALIGGTITAQVMEGPHVDREAHLNGDGEGTPTPGETPAAPGEVRITMEDNVFVVNGEENPTITVATGTTIPLSNEGRALHNVHIAGGGNYDEETCTTGGEDPCSDPNRIRGGASGIIQITVPPGTYDYRCDFHVEEMSGTIVVQ
jgi:plastocyanin/heme-degrading monooxygenase HmoA